MKRLGRKKGSTSAETKARIIESAQICFSRDGYAHSVIRKIAKEARVSEGLILAYFDSKVDLFSVALSELIKKANLTTSLKSGFKDTTEIFPRDGAPHWAQMIAHSIGDPDARSATAQLLAEHVLIPASTETSGPGSTFQAQRVLLLAVGFATMKILHDQNGWSSGQHTMFAEWLAAILQAPGVPPL